jgi:hypothetical protein
MEDNQLIICDYAVAFIDLLGQRAAMHGRHLPQDREAAIKIVKKSVGRIIDTQKFFEDFYRSYASAETFYSKLPRQIQTVVPDMAPGALRWQYFSDGLVVYVPLGSGMVASPVASLYGLLLASGMLCMIGLAIGGPIRAGIDTGWAVEYRPNELYGAALAQAYTLESDVAQWPRVVVGEGLVAYLKHYASSGDDAPSARFRRWMATTCLDLLAADVDGNHIVDYLGPTYSEITKGVFEKPAIEDARMYVEQQIAHWRQANDMKLVKRYENVKSYLIKHAS